MHFMSTARRDLVSNRPILRGAKAVTQTSAANIRSSTQRRMCDDEACGRGLPTWYARALDRLGLESGCSHDRSHASRAYGNMPGLQSQEHCAKSKKEPNLGHKAH